jgi:hypothetical protein
MLPSPSYCIYYHYCFIEVTSILRTFPPFAPHFVKVVFDDCVYTLKNLINSDPFVII